GQSTVELLFYSVIFFSYAVTYSRTIHTFIFFFNSLTFPSSSRLGVLAQFLLKSSSTSFQFLLHFLLIFCSLLFFNGFFPILSASCLKYQHL
ncbi:hypothetical protein A4A49_53088, partial [Nicotiana attenuata]